MAKIRHNDFNDTINDLLKEAEERGVIRLNFESTSWEGSSMLVGEKQMVNFGTCGYLGLENHPDIIENTIEFTKRYGVQFSVSRTYLISRESNYLENLLSEIYQGKKVITFSSTTLLHTSVLPCVVGRGDYMILDQQCHASIQTAAQISHAKGVPIDIVRHSNIDMLEHVIKQTRDKYEKIWYMIDGVYSMYGDLAPIDELNQLLEKYPQLHLYMDDAHGMSWSGANGCGKLYDKIKDNGRTIYVTTMAKGFGVMGGIVVFPNEAWCNKVKIYGGALTHSHPIPPPMLGASIASAKIHLSEKITHLQQSLKEKVFYANELLSQTDLPIISNPETPIYFIGTGQPSVGYQLNKRILEDGFYVNIAMFPAVPIKNTGLRFTITNHNSKEDIKALVSSIEENYAWVLERNNKTLNEIRKAFKLKELGSENQVREDDELTIQYVASIDELDEEKWNSCFEKEGNFNYASLKLMEYSFRNNELPEENWNFHYLLIKEGGKVLLATFFTELLMKDDLFAPSKASLNIERERLTDKYFLCSKTLMMGSLVTEGRHLFIDDAYKDKPKLLKLLIEQISAVQEKLKITNVILRDFDEENPYSSIFHELGFFKIFLPNSNSIDHLEEYAPNIIDSLSSRNRKSIRQEVFRYEHLVKVEVKPVLHEAELDFLYENYTEVVHKNTDINLFAYPKKFFEEINRSADWEFMLLSDNMLNVLLSIVCCYKTEKVYYPMFISLDYNFNEEFNSYKQIIFNIVKHAKEKNYHQVQLGFSADIAKKKLGAIQKRKVAYVLVEDQFNLEVIEKFNNYEAT